MVERGVPSRRYQKARAEALAAAKAEPKGHSMRGLLKRYAMPMVYFVQAEQLKLIKIGVTLDIGDRLKTLRVGCPDQLVLLGVIQHADAAQIEETAHSVFSAHRSHGEWFRPAPALLRFIDEYAGDAPSPITYFDRITMLMAAREGTDR